MVSMNLKIADRGYKQSNHCLYTQKRTVYIFIYTECFILYLNTLPLGQNHRMLRYEDSDEIKRTKFN